jgi:hypothetical protein
MDPHLEISTEIETAESLQTAYARLFSPFSKAIDDDSQSLAQPYPMRYVRSVTTDSTDATLSRP